MWEVLARQIPFEGKLSFMSQCGFGFDWLGRKPDSRCACVVVLRGDQPHADHVQRAARHTPRHQPGEPARWDPQQRHSGGPDDQRMDLKPRRQAVISQWVRARNTSSALWQTTGCFTLCWLIRNSSTSQWPGSSSLLSCQHFIQAFKGSVCKIL